MAAWHARLPRDDEAFMPNNIDTPLHQTALVAARAGNHARHRRRRCAVEGGLQGAIEAAVRRFRERNGP
jgi:hypothetical protein